MHQLALVEIPEDFITGTAEVSLIVWLEELLEPYAFDSRTSTEEQVLTCCDVPSCGYCHGTNKVIEYTNPHGYYDWYCWGGRWSNLLYPRTFTDVNHSLSHNPWAFVVDATRLTKILAAFLQRNETLTVFSTAGANSIDPVKETLTGAYYVLLDYHS